MTRVEPQLGEWPGQDTGSMRSKIEIHQLRHRLIGQSPLYIVLNTCDGGKVRIGGQKRQQAVYFYPGNGTTIGHDSDTLLADDEQHKGFRDAQDELTSLGYLAVGVSSQSAQEQQAAVIANRLTHQLASDESLRFAGHVNVPTFERGARRCYQRLTIIISGDTIREVIYPISTPRSNAAEVIERLKARRW